MGNLLPLLRSTRAYRDDATLVTRSYWGDPWANEGVVSDSIDLGVFTPSVVAQKPCRTNRPTAERRRQTKRHHKRRERTARNARDRLSPILWVLDDGCHPGLTDLRWQIHGKALRYDRGDRGTRELERIARAELALELRLAAADLMD